jgi:hypothetical protein
MSRLLRPLLLLACLCLSAAAFAADEDPQEQLAKAAATDAGSGWILGGGVAVTNPGYVGYSRQITPLPLFFYHYGRWFFAGFSGGYLLSNGDHYRLALVVQPTLNRLSASDSPQLAGIRSRQWSLAGGANLETFGDWGHLNLGLFHDLLDRNNGTSANLGYRFPFHALAECQPDQLLLWRERRGGAARPSSLFTRQRHQPLRELRCVHRHQRRMAVPRRPELPALRQPHPRQPHRGPFRQSDDIHRLHL